LQHSVSLRLSSWHRSSENE